MPGEPSSGKQTKQVKMCKLQPGHGNNQGLIPRIYLITVSMAFYGYDYLGYSNVSNSVSLEHSQTVCQHTYTKKKTRFLSLSLHSTSMYINTHQTRYIYI